MLLVAGVPQLEASLFGDAAACGRRADESAMLLQFAICCGVVYLIIQCAGFACKQTLRGAKHDWARMVSMDGAPAAAAAPPEGLLLRWRVLARPPVSLRQRTQHQTKHHSSL